VEAGSYSSFGGNNPSAFRTEEPQPSTAGKPCYLLKSER
jgi:hypothetical protein